MSCAGKHEIITTLLRQRGSLVDTTFYICAALASPYDLFIQAGYDNLYEIKDSPTLDERNRRVFVGVIIVNDALIDSGIFVYVRGVPNESNIAKAVFDFEDDFPELPEKPVDESYYNIWTDGDGKVS